MLFYVVTLRKQRSRYYSLPTLVPSRYFIRNPVLLHKVMCASSVKTTGGGDEAQTGLLHVLKQTYLLIAKNRRLQQRYVEPLQAIP